MPRERFTGLAAVVDAIRSDGGITQSRLVERVGLGRTVVYQRVAELEAVGLVASDGLGPSTGGRAPRRLRLRAEAGFVLGVDIATQELVAGVADLGGTILARRHEHLDSTKGPEFVLAAVERVVDVLLEETGAHTNLWSVGLGLPWPVAHGSGMPVELPTMPEWDRYPVQERLGSLWSAPLWTDHRINLLALGERRVNPVAAMSEHMLYLGGGATIGVAIVADGQIYRGARGLAGAIGHVPVPQVGEVVCRCGNIGCLEAVAGGAAMSRDARVLAETGQSPALLSILGETGTIRPLDITHAADQGDPAARALLHRSGLLLGGSLATLVNVFNPDLVVIGGGMHRARAHVLAAIREAIHRQSPPAATRHLRIEPSAVDEEIAGVIGAVEYALGGLFSREHLPTVLDARAAGLASASTAAAGVPG